MHRNPTPVGTGCLAALLLASCVAEDPMSRDTAPTPGEPRTVLFQDPMTGDWQDNWFLDGQRAELEHGERGLCFYATPSHVDKRVDRATFDAHHAVLWTKRVFEGDIRISYEFTPLETGGANLLYIHAQGIGVPPYVEDIHAWRQLRQVASMDKYFNYMNLMSLSLRENIRCRRYPWRDIERGLDYDDALVEPMVDHDGLPHGKTFRIVVEKRKTTCTLRIREVGSDTYTVDHTWDLSGASKDRRQPFVERGRIGLRQMGGNKVVYRDFKVERL
jgi:hypothetical protein